MKIVIFIIIILLLFYILFIHVKCIRSNFLLKDLFDKYNIIVFGAKGKGKDLLFQKVIYLNKKKEYLSNTNYGYKFNDVPISDLSVEPNTFENFIDGNINIISKKEGFENKNYFLSDAGIYLPCQYDYQLHKKYKSLPIFYALSRHLYNMNIHLNTQALERPWKAIREQADFYILCKGNIKLLFGIICKIRLYEKYNSALNKQAPMGSRILNKYSKAEVDKFRAENGIISDRIYYIRKFNIKYDSRYFHQVLFNVKAPIKKIFKKKKGKK